MKLKIKIEFLGQILSSSKLPNSVKVDEMAEIDYLFYYKMGLSHIFEEVCEKCDSINCVCEYKKIAEKEVKNYTEAKEDFKPKSRGKNGSN